MGLSPCLPLDNSIHVRYWVNLPLPIRGLVPVILSNLFGNHIFGKNSMNSPQTTANASFKLCDLPPSVKDTIVQTFRDYLEDGGLEMGDLSEGLRNQIIRNCNERLHDKTRSKEVKMQHVECLEKTARTLWDLTPNEWQNLPFLQPPGTPSPFPPPGSGRMIEDIVAS